MSRFVVPGSHLIFDDKPPSTIESKISALLVKEGLPKDPTEQQVKDLLSKLHKDGKLPEAMLEACKSEGLIS